jgi:alanine racemase
LRREPIEARLARAGLPPLLRSAWLEIDLDALAGNLAALRAAAGPGVRVEPVVKADAYGHGAVEVARAVSTTGADGLSVATLDEAVELRESDVTLPLLVLYPVPVEGVDEALARGIALTLGAGEPSASILEAAAAAHEAASRDGDRPPPLEVHLEVESGLGRGGVAPEVVQDTVSRIRATRGVRLAGVWTHLAAADRPDRVRDQDATFRGALAPLAEAVAWGPDAVRRHLAGSGGILGDGASRWDAVRPGLSLYGLIPAGVMPAPGREDATARIRPVLSLHARPVRVAELPAGHGVSYGPSFTTSRPSRIATLPVGYGDGWHRFLSDRSWALVRGVRVPLVGRVAMDAVMADVTDVPGPPITADDEFVLIGAQGDERITADELASTGGTISHEVVTPMSRRLARVYHAAGSAVAMRTLTRRET